MNVGRVIGASLLMGSLLSGCGGSSEKEAGKVQLEFFQNKPEAKESFDKIILKFNESHPDIKVSQVNPPEAETVLKTRVVKNDIPDIIGLGATDTYSVLAQSGIFTDLTQSELLNSIDTNYIQMLQDTTGMTNVTGVPYATNANGILYNKDIFKDMGLTIPKTWDELITTAEKLKNDGQTAFYFTYKDDWQTSLPFNAFVPNLVGIEFFEQRREGTTTFQEHLREVAEKQIQLMNYGHGDNFGKNYADGNRAFANGESGMYIQGSWAIPEIRKTNPNLNMGFFPFPTGNDPDENRLVSGVDTLLAISEDTQHKKEAEQFIAFLLEPENIGQYIEEQTAFAAVKGVEQDDPVVAELQPYLQSGKVIDFADHYIPAAVQLNSIVQSFLQNQNIDSYLKRLDTEWDKVADRK